MAEKLKCDVCGKEVKDQEGLDMHKKAKHSGSEKEEKSPSISKRKIKVYAIWIVVIGLLVWGIVSIVSGLGQYDEFAQCLVKNDVKMYGNDNCPHCQRQKNLFGSSWSIMKENYVRCGGPGATPESMRRCQEAGVQSTPTWQFSDNTTQAGVMQMEELDQRVEACEITEK
ncbi:MAG: hypothetical protein ABEI74_04660 [Candidatus Pacearchaeota archaeon]